MMKNIPKMSMVILMIVSLLIVGCGTGQSSIDINDLEAVNSLENGPLAKCLTEKGVKMYGTEWCPHCQNQKKAFGDAFQLINYIDCDERREECINAGVKGFPTWEVNGSLYSGEQPLPRLAALAECEMD